MRAVEIAQMENDLSLSSTYYFRSNHFGRYNNIIKEISQLNHNIGYHYECLATCHGNVEKAYTLFAEELDRLRQLVPVKTACAHGSPLSPYNNQTIWYQYDIHSLGIDYEPMLDTDFSTTLYLTDTGRRWDGHHVSVRDKVPDYQEQWEQEGLSFHTTDDLIHALRDPQHPIHLHPLLINTHPQRWMPFGIGWMAEATTQWWKNQAKRLLVLRSSKSSSQRPL